MKSKQNKLIRVSGSDSDNDYYIRPIANSISKDRYIGLKKIARSNSWREHCHHDFDCCGCIFKQEVEIIRYNGLISLQITQHRNY